MRTHPAHPPGLLEVSRTFLLMLPPLWSGGPQGPQPQARLAWSGEGQPQVSPTLDWTSLPIDQLPQGPPSPPVQPPTPAVVPSTPGRLLGPCGVGRPEQDNLPSPRPLTLPSGLAQRLLHPLSGAHGPGANSRTEAALHHVTNQETPKMRSQGPCTRADLLHTLVCPDSWTPILFPWLED